MPDALVVDDSILIRHTVRRFLEERGYQVHCASNGIEALRQLEALRPNVVITDIDMPEMDGPALIANLRSRPELSGIPIVVLSARRTASSSPIGAADAIVYKERDVQQQLANALTLLRL